jgi:AcrR family transcriptional regulator
MAVSAKTGARREKRPRRQRLETDERRAHLLELSMQAFSDRAYDDVSIDDIARAAGISKGLLYHYFPTKRDFYIAGLREAARQLTDKVLAAPTSAAPLEKLRHGLDTYLEHVLRHARAYRSLLRGGIGTDPEVAAVVEGVRATFRERLLEDAEGSPLAGARDKPILRLALHGWIGFVEAATLDWCERRDVPQAALRDLLVDMAFTTVKVAAGEPITRDW